MYSPDTSESTNKAFKRLYPNVINEITYEQHVLNHNNFALNRESLGLLGLNPDEYNPAEKLLRAFMDSPEISTVIDEAFKKLYVNDSKGRTKEQTQQIINNRNKYLKSKNKGYRN